MPSIDKAATLNHRKRIWRARVKMDGVVWSLGRYETHEDALNAERDFKRRHNIPVDVGVYRGEMIRRGWEYRRMRGC